MSASWPGVQIVGWAYPDVGGDPVVTEDASESTATDPDPHAFLQWKGTDVCLDFYCPCGQQSHFDGCFAYQLKCVACGRVFAMPHTVGLVEVTD